MCGTPARRICRRQVYAGAISLRDIPNSVRSVSHGDACSRSGGRGRRPAAAGKALRDLRLRRGVSTSADARRDVENGRYKEDCHEKTDGSPLQAEQESAAGLLPQPTGKLARLLPGDKGQAQRKAVPAGGAEGGEMPGKIW